MTAVSADPNHCYICFDPFDQSNETITPTNETVTPNCCNQKVHKVCIQMWADRNPFNPTCPNCRRRLPESITRTNGILSPRVRGALILTAKIALMALVSASLFAAGMSVLSGPIVIPAALLPTNAMLATAVQISAIALQIGVGIGLMWSGMYNFIIDAPIAESWGQNYFLNESANTLKDCGQYLFRAFCISAPTFICLGVGLIAIIVSINTVCYVIIHVAKLLRL